MPIAPGLADGVRYGAMVSWSFPLHLDRAKRVVADRSEPVLYLPSRVEC